MKYKKKNSTKNFKCKKKTFINKLKVNIINNNVKKNFYSIFKYIGFISVVKCTFLDIIMNITSIGSIE